METINDVLDSNMKELCAASREGGYFAALADVVRIIRDMDLNNLNAMELVDKIGELKSNK